MTRDPEKLSRWISRLTDDPASYDSFIEYMHNCIASANKLRDNDESLKTAEEIGVYHLRISSRIHAYKSILAFVRNVRGENNVALQREERGDKNG